MSESKDHLIKLNLVVTDEDIDNILDTAFNHIGYWTQEVVDVYPKGVTKETRGYEFRSEGLTRGTTFKIMADGKRKELTVKNFLKGIEKWAIAHATIDLEQIDGNDADQIVQFALFGEQVYA